MADAVFEGTVESIETRRRELDWDGIDRRVEVDEVWVRFRDVKSWKGELVLQISAGWGDQTQEFTVGRRYVVTGFRRPDSSMAASCSWSLSIEDARVYLEYLSTRSEAGPNGFISGYVRLSLGQLTGVTERPVPHARVILSGAANRSAFADASGAFSFHQLPPGNYEIDVARDEGRADLLGVDIQKSSVRLPDAQSCATVAPQLTYTGAIQGMVIDADLRPVTGAAVDVRLADPVATGGYFYNSVTTDHDGIYRFEQLPPGRYVAGVNLSDGPTEASPFALTYSEFDANGKPLIIELGPGEQREAVPIQVRRLALTVRVSGQVVTTAGAPAAGVLVHATAIGERDGVGPIVKTNATGHFGLTLFPNVSYWLSVNGEKSSRKQILTDADQVVVLKWWR